MRENKIIKRVIALALAGMLLIPTSVFAEDSPSNDVEFYAYTAEAIENSIPSIKNNASWRSRVFVEEAEEQGVLVQFKAATRNMRVEIPVQVNLDGLHAVFSDLQVMGTAEIAFIVTERQAYSDFVTDVNANALARLPFALTLNLATGQVKCLAAKSYSSENSDILTRTVYKSDNLKAENLAGKRWDLSFEKVDDANWKITLAGEEFMVEESDMLNITSEIDFSRCYMAISAWNNNSNTMSFVINSCHSGDNACADDPANAGLLSTAKSTVARIKNLDAITYEAGQEITSLYDLYSNMPSSMQSLVTNSGKLLDAYEVYQVVEQIHDIGEVTLDSKNKIDKVFKAYGELSDDLKREVTNLDVLNAAQAEYIKLKLGEYTTPVAPKVNYVYKDRVKTIYGEDVEQVVDVDGGLETTTVNKHITTTGRDGTQYLWIMFTAAGVVVLATAVTYFFLRRKNKKMKLEGVGNEEK